MYHKVTKDAGQLGKFAITPAELEADFAFLRDSGYQPVTMEALIEFVHGSGDLPEKPIVLTFDDGYFSDYRYVYPLAQAYDMQVVLSIMGKVTDELTADGRTDIIHPHLTWPQIEEMAASGLVEIQSHGYDLHCTRAGASGARRRRGESEAAYTERLGEDLTHFGTRVQEVLGRTPTVFTYPFGAKSEGSDGVLKDLGFCASLMTEGRPNLITRGAGDCLFSMGRLNRPHGRGVAEVLEA